MPKRTRKQKQKAHARRHIPEHVSTTEVSHQTAEPHKTTPIYNFAPKKSTTVATHHTAVHTETSKYIRADIIKTLILAATACVALIILSFVLK